MNGEWWNSMKVWRKAAQTGIHRNFEKKNCYAWISDVVKVKVYRLKKVFSSELLEHAYHNSQLRDDVIHATQPPLYTACRCNNYCVKIFPFSFLIVPYIRSVGYFCVWLYSCIFYSFPTDVTLWNIWVHVCRMPATHIIEKGPRVLTIYIYIYIWTAKIIEGHI